MNLAELRTLVDYHYWARDRMFEALERLTPEQFTQTIENSFPSVRDTVVHLWGAEVVWLGRWEGNSPSGLPGTEGFPDLASVRAAWANEERRLRAFLEQIGEDTARPIDYRLFDGRPYVQPFWQMLQHLVNHGSYHRGQVTMMLRQLHIAPAKQMDLSAFYRERVAAGT